ncbi:orc1/cdc6 family replication initiation protein [Salinigranum marinum]|uniref:Cdc6/Cdc18 family protein n=1 Tax=Salinigranum marinum TaxID=1515595 RepID=UPI002989AFFD|nr:orc1/cdc6 family replication initiation protein [Salinigranum marinum]
MTDEELDRDPLFRYEQPIFADEDLLKITHIPGPERIVGRDQHMQEVADALNPAIFGQEPTHLFVFGKTGTGKTLTSRSVSERVVTEAARGDTRVSTVFVDCGEQNTEASVIKTIARRINDPNRTGFTVPERGLATGDYYTRLWKVLDSCTDVVIIILDEIDMLQDDEVLRKLSRAGENRRISSSNIGIIGISNKIDFPEQLTERVKSSFAHDELVCPPYDANQLREILEHRRDAFQEGVLTDDVIPLTAALAAQEHGDARKAIDILRNAGRLATRNGDDQVTAEHVHAAKEKTEADRFAELIDGAPTQAKLILYALTHLTESHSESEFSTKKIFKAYRTLAETLDVKPLSERRVQEILKEQDFLNVIQSERRGRGRGRGMYATHRLLEDAPIVKRVLQRDSRLSEIGE